MHGYAQCAAGRGQSISRIIDHRCPGIGYQCHDFAGIQVFYELCAHLVGIVLVIGNQSPMLKAMQLQKFLRNPGIFAGNDICRAQNLQGSQRYIGGIADRCGDDIKTMRQLRCRTSRRFTRFGQGATVCVSVSCSD
jgi:hypothetical protein